MNAPSGIMLPNGQPAGGQGGVAVTLVHDPGVMDAVQSGLARLHDVHLFTEATRRFASDDTGVYEDRFGNAAREVLDDLNAFHMQVAAWSADKQAALTAQAEAEAAEAEAAENAAALDAAGDPDTDDQAAAELEQAAEVSA